MFHSQMNGIEIDGRRVKVNDVRTKNPYVPGQGPRQHEKRDGDDRHDQRALSRGSDKPVPRGFRVAVTGIPEDYTWDKLKDFLRSGTAGGNSVQYANVSRPGFG